MIANIEALIALAESGTMTRAATHLRITQSAVSKRIAALESELGQKLVEPVGRRVRLTAAGIRLIEKTTPFMASLKEALTDETPAQGGRLVIGISDSILSSWGPPILARVNTRIPRLNLVVNAHRSPVAIDQVRSGEYMLALCAVAEDSDYELKSEPLFNEPMVLVPAKLSPFTFSREDKIQVLTIEPHSATWSHLDKRIRANTNSWKFEIQVSQTVQSFACVVQMARFGFGHGLVPLGIAKALGITRANRIPFPSPGLARPISLVGRSNTFANPLVKTFHQTLLSVLSESRGNLVSV